MQRNLSSSDSFHSAASQPETSAPPTPVQFSTASQLHHTVQHDDPVTQIHPLEAPSSPRPPSLPSDWGLEDAVDNHLQPHLLNRPNLDHTLDNRDTLTLRAFDETLDQPTAPNYVIGVFDPAAETDDWGDDFVIEPSFGRLSSDSRTPNGSSAFPTWNLEHETPKEYTTWHLISTDRHPRSPDGFAESRDHILPMRQVPATAFATPVLSHASLLMFPSIGYDAGAVHPSCVRVRELFTRYHSTIRTHFDALVRDCGGVVALDDHTRAIYLLSGDSDLAALCEPHVDVSADMLLWKLEWANISGNAAVRAILLLALSDIYKNDGNLTEAIYLIRDALEGLVNQDSSILSIAVSTELEYENCVLHRRAGAIAEAGRALKRAIAYSTSLVAAGETSDGLKGSQQRGFWWLLRCKFLQAEMAYDLGDHDSAVQYYSEYIVESITRMIGVTSPPSAEQTILGSEFMRYCLFSPRLLVLSLWTSVLSLGEMKSFGAAADVASLASLVALAFGYDDANNAAAAVRARIKEIGVELRRQYDDISKNILQSNNLNADENRVTSTDRVTVSQFDYGAANFGDLADEFVEDWDTQLEKELNITIKRCDGDQKNPEASSYLAIDGNHDPFLSTSEVLQPTIQDEHIRDKQLSAKYQNRDAADKSGIPRGDSASEWATGSQQNTLIEAEIRQYLGRVTGTASAFVAQQMYPKPTQPFDGHELGPREHEEFLRRFVRSKDPVISRRIVHGISVKPQWHPSAVCKLNFNIEPIENIDALNSEIHVFSAEWALGLLEAVWKVVRSQVSLKTKQMRIQRLVLSPFSMISENATKKTVHGDADGRDRLETLATLLDVLRLAREVVTESGSEAAWFSSACVFLGKASTTVTPAAKAAVELFQAESRAHCGIRAVIPASTIEKSAIATYEIAERDQEVLGSSTSLKQTSEDAAVVPATLQQSVVDVMHALYWRTKAGFDESSEKNSLEKLLHAEVASSLFLTGSGVSPVDGSPIDLSEESNILHISKKSDSKSEDSSELVDETRRVSASELVHELQSLWFSLPSTGIVRAKLSYALAHFSQVRQRDFARAERFLFDGLRSLQTSNAKEKLPYSFFSRILDVSPISIVSSPLASGLLRTYGNLALIHSKYRYGIAALEAESDALRVRNMDKEEYRSAVGKVIEAAVENNDWRRALILAHNLRYFVHPKNGLRNEFLQLCARMHTICADVGCFAASVVPLRAYSALIYEERLRILLQRYKRRLAKKSGSRFRRYLPGSPLPKLLPGTKAPKNTLASFFETPLVTAAVDTSIRQPVTMVSRKMQKPSSTTSIRRKPRGSSSNTAGYMQSLLWPLPVASIRRQSQSIIAPTRESLRTFPVDRSGEVSEPSRSPDEHTQRTHDKRLNTNPSMHPNSEFQEEQRELLRIEAEQERTADCDRFIVELSRAHTEFAMADFVAADSRCRSLLEVSTPNASRYKVWELMARIRLKRREITKCLEFIDRMEHEFKLAQSLRETPQEVKGTGDTQRISLFRIHEVERESTTEEMPESYPPHVTFLRLRALIHGGRLEDALHLADKALEVSAEHSLWDQGRLHYLRGKVLFTMSSTSTPSFQRQDETKNSSAADVANLNLRVTELTMAAFETASQYYDAAGDEVCTAKSDLCWARTCIDFLFRRVVLGPNSGGGWTKERACSLLDKKISLEEVLDTVYNVVNVATTANLPLLLIDSMTALAEVKCIQGLSSATWSYWVSEAWKLFSRLFADAEDFTVVLTPIAPVSTLDRLRNLCGRLVRLVMCDEKEVSFGDMNKHLRLFEAYVTLHLSIDQKMNLASSAHNQHDLTTISEAKAEEPQEQLREDGLELHQPESSRTQSGKKRNTFGPAGSVKLSLSRKSNEMRGGTIVNERSDRVSHSTSENSAPRHPPGAFLHILGNEGVALGRQGLSLFINRPRQQVISAVKGTGAVLIPTNVFSNSKATPGDGPDELGREAEMIFPFKPSLGVGAMQILDDEHFSDGGMFGKPGLTFPGKGMPNATRLPAASHIHEKRGREDVPCNEVSKNETPADIRQGHANRQDLSKARSTPKGKKFQTRGQNRYFQSPSSHEATKAMDATSRKSLANQSDLASLLNAIIEEADGEGVRTQGYATIFGETTAHRVWSHYHRIKTETKRYMHGEISMTQLHERNNEALLGWVQCIPRSRKEWTVPESIGRRLVYILYAHGVIGYYGVERGGSIERVAFGGKKDSINTSEGMFNAFPWRSSMKEKPLRRPTDAERMYLFELVKGFKRDSVWHKNRDSEIVTGLAKNVLRAPRLFLNSSSPSQKSRSRPIVLIADLPIQILPWELFFDHVVIRSHCLLDTIRGFQGESTQSSSVPCGNEDPTIAAARPVVRFISFGPRRKVVDLERTEETRRQQLGFQGLLRLNHRNPSSLMTFLDLGGFSDPTAISAVVRPTGPLSSPLSQSRKAVKLFGLRISANIGRRNYPHIDFLKVAGLGSATTWDLKEAAMVVPPGASDKDQPKRDLGAYIPVFMFSYADLVDSSDSVFGLRRVVPNGILLFTPAIHMKVLVRHLEDDELSAELGRASGRINNRIYPDVTASARALVEYVSRFSREKRIPIVVFLGQSLVDVFPRRRLPQKQDG